MRMDLLPSEYVCISSQASKQAFPILLPEFSFCPVFPVYCLLSSIAFELRKARGRIPSMKRDKLFAMAVFGSEKSECHAKFDARIGEQSQCFVL